MCIILQSCCCLVNFLLTTEVKCCPPGFVDGEDRTGNVIDGTWRADGDTCTGMESVGQTGSNRQVRV